MTTNFEALSDWQCFKKMIALPSMPQRVGSAFLSIVFICFLSLSSSLRASRRSPAASLAFVSCVSLRASLFLRARCFLAGQSLHFSPSVSLHLCLSLNQGAWFSGCFSFICLSQFLPSVVFSRFRGLCFSFLAGKFNSSLRFSLLDHFNILRSGVTW